MDSSSVSSTNDLPGNSVATRLDTCCHSALDQGRRSKPKENETDLVTLDLALSQERHKLNSEARVVSNAKS